MIRSILLLAGLILTVGMVQAADRRPSTAGRAPGDFFAPVSLFYLDNPGLAAGIGYRFRSGLTIQAQAMAGRVDDVTLDARIKVGCRTYTRSVTGGGGSRTGAMLTVTVPLGKK